MAATMRCTRLHEPGKPLRLDTVAIPEPRPRDVLVQVKASWSIQNDSGATE
jgi:alcohol dehydrogenase